MKIAALFAALTVLCTSPCAAAEPVALVPLDDRPVTRQLPALLGRIAGVDILVPPRAMLGHYLSPGKPDEIIAWLNTPPRRRVRHFVISSDMLAYGGLVASRVPGVTYADAVNRLRELDHLHRIDNAQVYAFGTIMRLAPTGVPAIGPGKDFFAAYPVWKYLQQYANLHDPPLPAEIPVAEKLRAQIGDATLQAYVDTRLRNLDVDLFLVHLVGTGTIDRAVLGQDDAGPVGLHLKDVSALRSAAVTEGAHERLSIEPGADELGMALVSRALAHQIGWKPRIAVQYSTAAGAAYNDPLEFAPIANAIDGLIDLAGGAHDDVNPDITLFVRIPHGGEAADAALLAQIQSSEAAGHPVALADLTFLENSFTSQARFAKQLLESGAASKLDAYSSWNTNANTVGTAVAEAIAAGVGRRAHRYDALAHAEFTFNRFVDDYAFHDVVRPDLNAWLDRHNVPDHTYLLQDTAAAASDRNSALLWNTATSVLTQLYPQYHIAAIRITLPWDRTFETEIEAALAPALPR